jgi:hypothetical protein
MSKPNGKKSTGNALVHGVYSSELVLPWESEGEVEELHAQFREDFNPEGASQEEVVLEITHLHLLKRRARRGAQLNRRRLPPLKKFSPGPVATSWEELQEHMLGNAHLHRMWCNILLSNLRAVEIASAAVLVSIEEKKQDTTDAMLKNERIINHEKALESFAKALDSHDQQSEHAAQAMAEQEERNAPIVALYSQAEIERELNLIAQIDARFEKAISRLAMLKEFKRMYGQKEITATPIQPKLEPVMGQLPPKEHESQSLDRTSIRRQDSPRRPRRHPREGGHATRKALVR